MRQSISKAERRIRVGVADSTPMSSQLVVGALRRSRSNFDVIPLPTESTAAIHEIRSHRPDVTLLSANLQDGPLSGFRVLHEFSTSEERTPIVMLLDSTQPSLVVDAFRAGARGVFCRDYSFTALPKCIRRVHEGQVWVSSSELECLLDLVISLRPMRMYRGPGLGQLTEREKAVVRLACEGMRNNDIASQLRITEHTVRNYFFRIFEKLGVSSRMELVLHALNREDFRRPAVLSPADRVGLH